MHAQDDISYANSHVFLKIMLATWGRLWLHTYCTIFVLFVQKNVIKILTGIALNL